VSCCREPIHKTIMTPGRRVCTEDVGAQWHEHKRGFRIARGPDTLTRVAGNMLDATTVLYSCPNKVVLPSRRAGPTDLLLRPSSSSTSFVSTPKGKKKKDTSTPSCALCNCLPAYVPTMETPLGPEMHAEPTIGSASEIQKSEREVTEKPISTVQQFFSPNVFLSVNS
jgi:hypothetical protein